MSMMTKIKTGVPGFDVISAGGLPVGRSTLVVGRSGTGKTITGAWMSEAARQQGLASGADAYLTEPIDEVTLLREVVNPIEARSL
ncbi:MAG: hypothetical protein HYU37_16645 [Acidobacteria bacterium]|nr:hypothetical protein [Acidobacteriota bacterium]